MPNQIDRDARHAKGAPGSDNRQVPRQMQARRAGYARAGSDVAMDWASLDHASRNGWPLTGSIELVSLPSAPFWARKYTALTLDSWGLDGLVETAELLVSELVTNAVRADGIDTERVTYPNLGRLKPVRLRLAAGEGLLLVEVWDNSQLPSIAAQADLDDEGGRGLQLVAALSKEWSYYFPAGGGKWVWCEVGA